MKIHQCLIFGALLIAPAFLVITYVNEFISVDSALDSGASYNYQTGKADYSQTHPYISFTERQGDLINIALLSFVASLVYGCTIYFAKKKEIHTETGSHRKT